MKKGTFRLLALAAWLVGNAGLANEVVIATNEQCGYQIVLPDSTNEPLIAKALADAAGVMREMFLANGCQVPVVTEGCRQAETGHLPWRHHGGAGGGSRHLPAAGVVLPVESGRIQRHHRRPGLGGGATADPR